MDNKNVNQAVGLNWKLPSVKTSKKFKKSIKLSALEESDLADLESDRHNKSQYKDWIRNNDRMEDEQAKMLEIYRKYKYFVLDGENELKSKKTDEQKILNNQTKYNIQQITQAIDVDKIMHKVVLDEMQAAILRKNIEEAISLSFNTNNTNASVPSLEPITNKRPLNKNIPLLPLINRKKAKTAS